jgi:predicted nucleotidyltransferase component of viral defense system
MKEVLLDKIRKLGSAEEKYNVAREFLQELILQIMDRSGYFSGLAFVGGTALRILYDLLRFSEDLDFCLINKRGFKFDRLLAAIRKELELNGFEIEISRGKDRTVLSEFIKFKGLLYELGIAGQKSEKLFIKLEIDSNPPSGYGTEVQLVNKDFLFKVQSYDLPSLFASKLHAFLFRKYAKGRDCYDLLWFLSKRTPVNYKLLSAAASQTENKTFHINAELLKRMLIDKVNKADFSHVSRDVAVFLHKKEEKEYFKKEYFLAAIEKGI